jgi:hypothetical protein
MTVAYAQVDLFASEVRSLTIDDSFSTAKRIAIDAHSWVEIVPNWLSGPADFVRTSGNGRSVASA